MKMLPILAVWLPRDDEPWNDLLLRAECHQVAIKSLGKGSHMLKNKVIEADSAQELEEKTNDFLREERVVHVYHQSLALAQEAETHGNGDKAQTLLVDNFVLSLLYTAEEKPPET